MISIRENTFESNSSSTHSLTIVETAKFEAWKANNGEYFLCDDTLLSPEEMYEKMLKSEASSNDILKTKDTCIAAICSLMKKTEVVWSSEDYDRAEYDENEFELTDYELETLKAIQETFDTVETFNHFENDDYEESYWETETVGGVSVTAFGKYGYS